MHLALFGLVSLLSSFNLFFRHSLPSQLCCSVQFQERGQNIFFVQTCWIWLTLMRVIFVLSREVKMKCLKIWDEEEANLMEADAVEVRARQGKQTDRHSCRGSQIEVLEEAVHMAKGDFDQEAVFWEQFSAATCRAIEHEATLWYVCFAIHVESHCRRKQQILLSKTRDPLNLTAEELASVLVMVFRVGLVNMHRICAY